MSGVWSPIAVKVVRGAVRHNFVSLPSSRFLSVMSGQGKGLLLGLYHTEKNGEVAFTKAATSYQAARSNRLGELVQLSGLAEKKGKSRVFYGVDPEFSSVAVVSLGKQGAGYNEQEQVDEGRENIRAAVAAGVRALQEAGVKDVLLDPCGDPEAVGEAATLALWSYDELKMQEKRKTPLLLSCYTDFADDAKSVMGAWQRGVVLGEGQNFARRLMETPANYMTPTRFAQLAAEVVGSLNNCTVTPRDRAWAESQKMGSFLSVSNGSEEPPVFLEVEYSGGAQGQQPFALVGKGITFDSGGISLKPSAGMDSMRADMGGAACSLAAVYTAARLNIPINIRAFMALSENMPSGKATKPGDVVTAMNGKTIQVDNTDAEGRLVLADALCYAQTFNPTGIIDMATLTGAMGVALGASAAGVFTNSTPLFDMLQKAGTVTGDRVWRMPLFELFTSQITEPCPLADVLNSGINTVTGRSGGACTAAAFLKEFVTHKNWAHIDIAGVMSNKSEVPYLGKGMAGRPTRTIVEFLNQLSKQ